MRRVGQTDGLRGDGDVGTAIDVCVDHLRVVHAVQMVAGQNQVVVGVVPDKMAGRLPHRVRCALKPALAVGCLLGCQDFDEPVAEQVHAIRLADMTVERGRIELGEDENPAHVGMQAVADRYVNQSIFAADWHRWLRAELGQRKQPFALASPKDDRENLVVDSHLGTEC